MPFFTVHFFSHSFCFSFSSLNSLNTLLWSPLYIHPLLFYLPSLSLLSNLRELLFIFRQLCDCLIYSKISILYEIINQDVLHLTIIDSLEKITLLIYWSQEYYYHRELLKDMRLCVVHAQSGLASKEGIDFSVSCGTVWSQRCHPFASGPDSVWSIRLWSTRLEISFLLLPEKIASKRSGD